MVKSDHIYAKILLSIVSQNLELHKVLVHSHILEPKEQEELNTYYTETLYVHTYALVIELIKTAY